MSLFDDGPSDEIDRGILHLLQKDARHSSTVNIAKQLPVSEGTVRNRIQKMEREGIIEGYIPVINYEAAGVPLRILFTCTAPIEDRAELAEKALDIVGVVNVREFTSSTRNVRAVTVASATTDMTDLTQKLTDIGLTVDNTTFLVKEQSQPFDNFGADAVNEE